MSTVIGFLSFGKPHQYHGGIDPTIWIQIHQNDTPSLEIYKKQEDRFERIGVYAPNSNEDSILTHSITDILLSTVPNQFDEHNRLDKVFAQINNDEFKEVKHQILNNNNHISNEILAELRSVIRESSSNLVFFGAIDQTISHDTLINNIKKDLRKLNVNGKLMDSGTEFGQDTK